MILIQNIKWVLNKSRKPRKGGEYNVVWVLDDNQYPTVTTMEYDAIDKVWRDVIGSSKSIIAHHKILYWSNLPKAPKGIPKNLWII